MARKHQLRVQRAGTVINVTSKKQESDIIQALQQVVDHISAKFGKRVSLVHEPQWYLRDIISSVNPVDECDAVYKPPEVIIEEIAETVQAEFIIRPVLNIKGGQE